MVGISEVDGEGAAYLPAGTESVKVFVWESLETMRPLCECAEQNVN